MILLLFVSVTLGIFGIPSHGQVVWMDGGLIGDLMISGTHEYQELCFITGEPVLLKGTVKLPVIPTDKDTYSLKYTFTLSNTAKNITLVRDVTFNVTKTQNGSLLQTSYVKTLPNGAYKETITTATGVYTLGKYTFTDSRLDRKSVV